MKIDEQIITRLRQMLTAPHIVFSATIKAVDKDTMTCTVNPPDGVDMLDVRLKAAVEQVSEGIVEIPAIDSSVLVVIIGNREENAFVAKCSKVEEVLFYGGENGGLIKVNELVAELEKVNDFLEAIKSGFDDWLPPVSPDAGAALVGIMKARLATVSIADYSNIENLKVKH